MKLFNCFKSKLNQQNTISEDEYYKKLFIENKLWNKPTPNKEELYRWEVIKEFVKYVKSKGKFTNDSFEILDLGCGRGWLTKLLSSCGNILGLEPVSKVVAHAKEMFPQLKFISGTSKDLIENEHKNKYDLIVSSEVIEHISDERKDDFVKDIATLLRDKGYVILTTPRQEAQQEWNKYLPSGQPIEDWITEKDLQHLLERNNFSVIKKENISMSPPVQDAPKVEIYQLWLFQKN